MAELIIISYPSGAKAERLRALLALSRQAYLIQSALDARSDDTSDEEEKAGRRSDRGA
ncbi:hypothetical protein [Microvirga sp. KLBC 81]|uniref:hypothetical protein n=1 Tax=Microvirga sp. KLBC 81 TaxID=1862707 RepID=UPI001401FA2E|nr:hypothetical protein [Microvirga sp. KLBC 81]